MKPFVLVFETDRDGGILEVYAYARQETAIQSAKAMHMLNTDNGYKRRVFIQLIGHAEEVTA